MKDARLARLIELCSALPEAEVTNPAGNHHEFIVRKKKFAYYLDDHHGDGIVALCCKTSHIEQAELIATEPERYFMPAYIGSRGWVALRLDLPEVDLDEVAELVVASYRLVAPKRLAAQV